MAVHYLWVWILGCKSPSTTRFPSALEMSLGTSLGPWEISWLSRDLFPNFPIHPFSQQCRATICIGTIGSVIQPQTCIPAACVARIDLFILCNYIGLFLGNIPRIICSCSALQSYWLVHPASYMLAVLPRRRQGNTPPATTADSCKLLHMCCCCCHTL